MRRERLTINLLITDNFAFPVLFSCIFSFSNKSILVIKNPLRTKKTSTPIFPKGSILLRFAEPQCAIKTNMIANALIASNCLIIHLVFNYFIILRETLN